MASRKYCYVVAHILPQMDTPRKKYIAVSY